MLVAAILLSRAPVCRHMRSLKCCGQSWPVSQMAHRMPGIKRPWLTGTAKKLLSTGFLEAMAMSLMTTSQKARSFCKRFEVVA